MQFVASIRVIPALHSRPGNRRHGLGRPHPALRVITNWIELLAPRLQRCQGTLHAIGQRVVYTKWREQNNSLA